MNLLLIFCPLLIAAGLHSAQSYPHRQSGHRLGRSVKIGGQRFDPALKMFWHVGIYSKRFSPYKHICGGNLVTPNAVISAAQCFWSDRDVLPADLFAVGAGKLYRRWNETADESTAQRSDVAAIHIPVRYHGQVTNYQEDIAVVIVAKSFVINDFAIRPLCVNFDDDFDEEQLSPGNKGDILSWKLTVEDGPPSYVLTHLKLPVVGIKDCETSAGPGFLQFLTSDKFCAGFDTGNHTLCRGDGGGGLVFLDQVGSSNVPYLRGVTSTVLRSGNACNTKSLTALTQLHAHRRFLRRHIPDIEDYCEDYYPLAYTVRERPRSIRNRDNERKLRERVCAGSGESGDVVQ